MSDHERTDVNVKGIVFAGGGIALFMLAVLGVSLLMGRGFGAMAKERDHQRLREEPGGASLSAPGDPYDGPLLQVLPEDELAAMRAGDAQKMNAYGWEDKPGGAVRIPIQAAMRRLVEHGVPSVASPPVTFEELQRRRGNSDPP